MSNDSWKDGHKEHTSSYNREYYQKNKERDRARKAQNVCRYHENHYEQQLLNYARKRAKARGLDFTLELSDIMIPETCPYLKVSLTRVRGQGYRVWTNASIDRIDNTKGYTKDNIQIISRQANQMKAHATEEQLLEFAHSVIELHRNFYQE